MRRAIPANSRFLFVFLFVGLWPLVGSLAAHPLPVLSYRDLSSDSHRWATGNEPPSRSGHSSYNIGIIQVRLTNWTEPPPIAASLPSPHTTVASTSSRATRRRKRPRTRTVAHSTVAVTSTEPIPATRSPDPVAERPYPSTRFPATERSLATESPVTGSSSRRSHIASRISTSTRAPSTHHPATTVASLPTAASQTMIRASMAPPAPTASRNISTYVFQHGDRAAASATAAATATARRRMPHVDFTIAFLLAGILCALLSAVLLIYGFLAWRDARWRRRRRRRASRVTYGAPYAFYQSRDSLTDNADLERLYRKSLERRGPPLIPPPPPLPPPPRVPPPPTPQHHWRYTRRRMMSPHRDSPVEREIRLQALRRQASESPSRAPPPLPPQQRFGSRLSHVMSESSLERGF